MGQRKVGVPVALVGAVLVAASCGGRGLWGLDQGAGGGDAAGSGVGPGGGEQVVASAGVTTTTSSGSVAQAGGGGEVYDPCPPGILAE